MANCGNVLEAPVVWLLHHYYLLQLNICILTAYTVYYHAYCLKQE